MTRPFWISQFPVTLRQCRLAGVYPRTSIFEEKFADDKDALLLAHVRISDVPRYFEWLNEKFGSTLPKGWVFRPSTQGEATLVRERCVSLMKRDNSWVDALHAKGLFTDCQDAKEIARHCSKLGIQHEGLVIGVAKYRTDKTVLGTEFFQVGLDRVSMPDVDVLSFPNKIWDKGLGPHLAKVLNYQHLEVDPFRYAVDGDPHYTWGAFGGIWGPLDIPMPVLIRVAVGPDYVGEWKAKNGK